MAFRHLIVSPKRQITIDHKNSYASYDLRLIFSSRSFFFLSIVVIVGRGATAIGRPIYSKNRISSYFYFGCARGVYARVAVCVGFVCTIRMHRIEFYISK